MQLQVSHHIVAKLDRPELYLRNTLKGFDLMFQVTGDTVSVDDRICMANIHAVRIAAQTAARQNVILGTARPDVPMRFTQDGRSRRISHDFALSMQPSEIHALEDMRNGGDLALQLTFLGEGSLEGAPAAIFS